VGDAETYAQIGMHATVIPPLHDMSPGHWLWKSTQA
jgi:hypothetical protein